MIPATDEIWSTQKSETITIAKKRILKWVNIAMSGYE